MFSKIIIFGAVFLAAYAVNAKPEFYGDGGAEVFPRAVRSISEEDTRIVGCSHRGGSCNVDPLDGLENLGKEIVLEVKDLWHDVTRFFDGRSMDNTELEIALNDVLVSIIRGIKDFFRNLIDKLPIKIQNLIYELIDKLRILVIKTIGCVMTRHSAESPAASTSADQPSPMTTKSETPTPDDVVKS